MSISFAASSWVKILRASFTGTLRFLCFFGMSEEIISCSPSPMFSREEPESIPIIGREVSSTSISMSSSSSSPASRRFLHQSRPALYFGSSPLSSFSATSAAAPKRLPSGFENFLGSGTNTSRIRSSTSSLALSCTSSMRCCLTMRTATSASSRTIDSTSRPTYPTSVNFVASTFTNGAFTSFASRRAISVLPTPVEPIIKIFFGITSSRIDSSIRRLLHRFLRAMATARLALSCPTIYLLSSSTICFGVCSFNAVSSSVKLFHFDIMIRKDTDIRCYGQRFLCNLSCRHILGMLYH